MTLVVTHNKVSAVTPIPAPTSYVTPTDWNANHALTGTADASQLNANVVQSVVSDTNVTGTISSQTLTLGWTGTLAAGRLNSNVVQAVTNDTNVTGSISAQNLTLGWTGTLAVTRGGTGISSLAVGDLIYASTTTAFARLAAVATGSVLVSAGVSTAPSWSATPSLSTLQLSSTGVPIAGNQRRNDFATTYDTTGVAAGANLVGLRGITTSSGAGSPTGHGVGVKGETVHNGSGTWSLAIGTEGSISNTGTGTLTEGESFLAFFDTNVTGKTMSNYYSFKSSGGAGNAGTITNWVDFYSHNLASEGMSGSVTNRWTLKNDDPLKILQTAGVVSVTNTTAASSTTTGALTVSGGMGVSGSIYGGSLLDITNTDATNAVTQVNIVKNWTSANSANFACALTVYADQGRLVMRRANGSQASPSAVAVNDIIGNVQFRGYGTSFSTSANAAINAIAEETFAGTNFGTNLQFNTTSIGSSSSVNRFELSANGNIVCGTQLALATNATDGHLCIPTCAGTPTGTPTAYTGKVQLIYDTTNNKMYVFNGAWKGGTAPGAWS